MPVFHAPTRHTSGETLGESLQRLQAALVMLSEGERVEGGFEDFERELHALFTQAEREVLAEELGRFDVDVPYVVIDG